MSSLLLAAWNMKVVSSPSLLLWLGVFSCCVFSCTNSSGYLPHSWVSAIRKLYCPLHHHRDLGFLPVVFSHAQNLLDVYHNLRHCRVCGIPWRVHNKSLDDGWKKVALGAIRDPSVQCANTRVADNWYYLFLAGQSSYNLFHQHHSGWLFGIMCFWQVTWWIMGGWRDSCKQGNFIYNRSAILSQSIRHLYTVFHLFWQCTPTNWLYCMIMVLQHHCKGGNGICLEDG